ncbi:MAG: DUF4126 domain-containing protein [Desulfuromonadales bacterium]|nr:DUF4126 domain-containing protein [Desulfuromonadales bacterium]
MEQLDQIATIIAMTMGVAWASGINLYATILVLGLLGASGHMVLPADLMILTDPLVLFAAGAMYLIEFVADKTPGVDTSWDTLHTFIRIPAGAALAVGAVGEVDPVVALAVAIVGGGLTAGTHAAKAGGRVLINTSPEPFSNWFASVAEDLAVIGGLFAALYNPWLFLLLLALFVVLLVWLLPKIWRGVKLVFTALVSFFRGGRAQPVPTAPPPIPTELPTLEPDRKRQVSSDR